MLQKGFFELRTQNLYLNIIASQYANFVWGKIDVTFDTVLASSQDRMYPQTVLNPGGALIMNCQGGTINRGTVEND